MKLRTVVGIATALAAAWGTTFAQVPNAGSPAAARPGSAGTTGSGVVMGTIQQIDPAQNAIQLQAPGAAGDQAQWILVTPQTTVHARGSTTVAQLQPNDTVVISGVPAAIRATQIEAGELPTPSGSAAAATPPAAFRLAEPSTGPDDVPQPPPTAAPRGAAAGAQPRAASLPGGLPAIQVAGKVVTTNPFVVMLPGNVPINVVADASTRMTTVIRGSLADLRPGLTIRAMGRPNAQGHFVAAQVEAGFDPTPAAGAFGGPDTVVPPPPGAEGEF